MPDNRISAAPSQADQRAVRAAVDATREKLPFLIDLTAEENRVPRLNYIFALLTRSTTWMIR